MNRLRYVLHAILMLVEVLEDESAASFMPFLIGAVKEASTVLLAHRCLRLHIAIVNFVTIFIMTIAIDITVIVC